MIVMRTTGLTTQAHTNNSSVTKALQMLTRCFNTIVISAVATEEGNVCRWNVRRRPVWLRLGLLEPPGTPAFWTDSGAVGARRTCDATVNGDVVLSHSSMTTKIANHPFTKLHASGLQTNIIRVPRCFSVAVRSKSTTRMDSSVKFTPL